MTWRAHTKLYKTQVPSVVGTYRDVAFLCAVYARLLTERHTCIASIYTCIYIYMYMRVRVCVYVFYARARRRAIRIFTKKFLYFPIFLFFLFSTYLRGPCNISCCGVRLPKSRKS